MHTLWMSFLNSLQLSSLSIDMDCRSNHSWASLPLAGTQRFHSGRSSDHTLHGRSCDDDGTASRVHVDRSANASARDSSSVRRSGGDRDRSCSTDDGSTGRKSNRTGESMSCPSLSVLFVELEDEVRLRTRMREL